MKFSCSVVFHTGSKCRAPIAVRVPRCALESWEVELCSPTRSHPCYSQTIVELKEQASAPTLARKLGDVTHVSPLLMRVCRLSGLPEGRAGEWLLKCAIGRGAKHYVCDFPAHVPEDSADLSNEELGVALCLGHHRYDTLLIRAAAQLLSSPETDGARLARLAEMERVEPVLRHIAEVAARYAPALEPWAYLRTHLRQRLTPPPGVLPHWSRLVNYTGVTPFGGGPSIQWLIRE